MSRTLRPLSPQGDDASRRSASGDEGATQAARPNLRIVRPEERPDWTPVPPHEMWNDDPLFDSTALTRLADWPEDAEFEPLIASAREVGDIALVAQLEDDRALCARARAQLVNPTPLPRDTSA